MSGLVRDIIEAAVILVVTAGIVIAVRIVLATLADRFDQKNSNLTGDLLRAMRQPASILILLAGIYIALLQVDQVADYIVKYNSIFDAVTAVVVLVAITSIINLAIRWYVGTGVDKKSQLSMFRKLAILIVWIIGAVQILAMMGVKVTALVASLGIAGLAVGLALQDTIANLFAGFYLVVDRTVRLGDYIKLDSGQEGFVETVGWRNTQVRLASNNLALIPNAKLIQSVITNMTLPNPVLSIYTYAGVDNKNNLERVEKAAIEAANEVLKSFPGGDMSFPPVLRFKEFIESSITFVVVFRATDVDAQYLLQHEYMKALQKRFNQENIDIFFPIKQSS
ncbi:mechanosensitive ion channel family protein [bacterium]|nr:mechanosensitive ion channel family protein [bacterium]